MRLSAVVVMSVLSVGSITAQECDSIRIEGSKYFCNDMRLRKKADFQNALAANQEALAEYNAAAGLNIAANVIGGIGACCLNHL